jgi:hypothetical protein
VAAPLSLLVIVGVGLVAYRFLPARPDRAPAADTADEAVEA